MPRRTTSFQVDNFYHIYNRGNNYQNIFFERENYLYFLRLTTKHLIEKEADVVAYCLMPNHYHFLVYLKNTELSASMRSLSLAYTKAINKSCRRVGSLFQGSFKSIHVNQDSYLANLTRYIHLNPVKAGLVEHARDWEFSSYLEYAGTRQGKLPKTEILKAQFSNNPAYQQFLDEQQLPENSLFQRLMLDE